MVSGSLTAHRAAGCSSRRGSDYTSEERGDAVAAVPSLCVSLLVGSRKTSRPIALAACRRVTALRSSPLFRKPLHGKLTQAAAQLVLPSAEVGRTLS